MLRRAYRSTSKKVPRTNAPRVAVPRALDAFEDAAARSPAAIAIESSSTTLSYEVLERRSATVAHRLRQHGVEREVVVGICGATTPDLIVAILGVVRAGGAF